MDRRPRDRGNARIAIEEALFFCYHEGLDVHREILVAVAPDEDTPEAEPGAGELPE